MQIGLQSPFFLEGETLLLCDGKSSDSRKEYAEQLATEFLATYTTPEIRVRIISIIMFLLLPLNPSDYSERLHSNNIIRKKYFI